MSGWLRVNRERPCPICSRPDWCLITADESAAICARTESEKRCGEAGWLHRLRDTGRRERAPRVRRVWMREGGPDFSAMTWRAGSAVNMDRLERFASDLGVSVESLRRLRIGWDGEAWIFPMWGSDSIVGIRRRLLGGRKFSVAGGREGLFLPNDLPGTGPLLVCEGPTDTAAMLDLGFAAIGRPSCTGGVRLVVETARGRHAVIVADADEPGQRGANALASVLCLYCPGVRIVVPPPGIKDAREWVRCGATAADVQAAIDAAEPMHLPVRGVHRG